jgi:hypothetical protein
MPALEFVTDVGQPEERFSRGSRRCAEEVAATERVVAADADDQVRRVRRQKPQLFAYVSDRAPVDGSERCFPPVRQPLPHLPDDVGRASCVGGVVEDRISQKNNVVHGLITPGRRRVR